MEKKSVKDRNSANLFSSENIDYKELKILYEKLKGHIEVIEKQKRSIPLFVFSSKLSGLETIVKYLRENLHLNFKEIGILLGRSVKTVWQAYNFSKRKYSRQFTGHDFSLTIPVSVFKDRRLSVLEHIVIYLKNTGMKFSEIARRLERDPRTIWTVYSRAKKKNAK